MDVFNYNPVTREFVGVSAADQDPLDAENYLIPADATVVTPPSVTAKQVAIYGDGAWTVLADYRGEVWYDADRKPVVVDSIGEPTGLTNTCPPEPPPSKQQLRAHAATKRFALEVGGITSSTFGPLATDRDTRAILAQAIQSLNLGLATAPIRFKTPNGFVSLDREAFLAISGEIVAFVQSTFNIEDTVDAAIADETITTFAEIDAHF